jgi:plastocyanin
MSTASATVAVSASPASLFDRKPFYTLLSATGFGLLVVAGLLLIVQGYLDNSLEFLLVFALFMIVPGLVGIVLSWRVGRWTFAVPSLLAAALLVMLAPFLPWALSHPESALDFLAVAYFLIGALAGIAGGVASIVQWRRGTARPGATAGQRRAYGTLLVAIAGVTLLAVSLSVVARTSLAAEVRASSTAMTIKHGAYSVDPLQAAPGETVRLAVRNDDATLHTFTLPEAGIDVTIPPGAERLVEFTAPAAGTYTWFCVPHHSETEAGPVGMVGTLVVAP